MKANNEVELLKNKGIKITPPRRVILETALLFEQPFQAEQLLEQARKTDRAISLATVYRFIALLLQHEIIREIDVKKDGHQYYEINRHSSFAVGHIICHNCQQVIEVTDPCLSLRETLVANDLGFTPTKLNLRIEANCQELDQKGHCSRQKKQPATLAPSAEKILNSLIAKHANGANHEPWSPSFYLIINSLQLIRNGYKCSKYCY